MSILGSFGIASALLIAGGEDGTSRSNLRDTRTERLYLIQLNGTQIANANGASNPSPDIANAGNIERFCTVSVLSLIHI